MFGLPAHAASPPVARDDVARTDTGALVSLFVIDNDFDPDGDPFSVVEAATPAHGSVAFGGNFVNYTPDPGFSGMEEITYTIQDSTGDAGLGTARVWVDTGVSGPESPVPDDDYAVVYQGASVAFTTAQLLANDDDPQSETLSVVAVSEPSNDGVLTGTLAGGFSYTPSSDAFFVDTDHTINYLVTDTAGHVTQGRLIIRILAAGDPNQAPIARDDVARTDTGAVVSLFVIDNDFDPDGDAFSVVGAATPAHGSVAFGGNFVNYTPDPGFSGIETITYRLRDSHGLLSLGTARVWVDTGVSGPESPVPDDDYAVVYQGASVAFTTAQLLANDDDPQSETLSVVAVSEPSNDGVLTGTLAGGFSYTPSSDAFFVDTDHTINYLVTDTAGHVTQGRLIIRILAAGDPNQAPIARDDVARTDTGAVVSVFVIDNDFDPDGDAFSVVGAATPAHGSVAFGGNFVNYTPDPGFSGIETITYRLRDSHGLLSLGTARVWVDTGVSGPESPVPDDDYAVVYQGASVAFTTAQLLANDDDPQSETLSVVAVSEPSNDGVLTGTLAGGFSYTPSSDASFVDTDHTINYLVTDTAGHVTQGRLIIRILAAGDPNQAPIAVPDTASTVDTVVSLFVIDNDFDPDGDAFSVVGAATPAHGSVAFGGNFVNYTPDPGFSGIETITYHLRDSHGLLANGLAVVSVNTSGDHPPIASSASYGVQAGATQQITLSAVDPEGQPLSWSLVTPPAGNLSGSLSGAAPTLTYTAPTQPGQRLLRVRGQRRQPHRPGHDHDPRAAPQRRSRRPR